MTIMMKMMKEVIIIPDPGKMMMTATIALKIMMTLTIMMKTMLMLMTMMVAMMTTMTIR